MSADIASAYCPVVEIRDCSSAIVMEHRKFNPSTETSRCYTICSFERGLVVPKVQLIDAANDEDALAMARASDICSVREVWDRHRLVAILEPMKLETAAAVP